MARKGENIYHRRDGRWEGRYIKGRREDGKAVFGYVYGKRYSDVKIELLKLKVQYGQFSKNTLRKMYKTGTLEEWAAYWLEILVAPDIKASSKQCYCRLLNLHILPALGKVPLAELDGSMLQTYFDAGEFSASMKYSLWRLLNAIFTAAVRRNVLTHNPCSEIEKARPKRKKPRFLDQREQRELEAVLLKKQRLMELIALYSGLRISEVCAIETTDFDRKLGALHIRQATQRVEAEEGPYKTALVIADVKSENSERLIYLPPFLTKMICNYLDTRSFESEFLFVNKRNDGPAEPRTLQYQFERIISEAELKDVHFHTLRHSYATRCLEWGLDVQSLSEMLGHSSARITLEFYAHSTNIRKQQFARKVKPLSRMCG